MRIIKEEQAIKAEKPEGINVKYFLFNEYEIHYNEQHPNSSQVWHHHERVWETIYIIDGELTVKWREENQEKLDIVRKGDLIEVEYTPHSFINNTNNLAKFLVIKQILKGIDNKEIMKSDKIIDQ